MNNILECITRQDIYNIAVPVCICIAGWLLPLLRNNEPSFARKWMRKKERSDRDSYGYFFFIVIMFGLLFQVVGILTIFAVSYLMGQLSIKMSHESMKIILSAICGVCICAQMFSFHIDFEKIELRILKKIKKQILLFLYYAPFVSGTWLWCFSPHIANPIPNVAMCIVIFACEIISFFVLDGNNTHKYLCMKLYFNDGSEVAYPTGCVKQCGNWIVAEELSTSREVRYRREDLVKVEYFNIKTPSEDGSNAKSS